MGLSFAVVRAAGWVGWRQEEVGTCSAFPLPYRPSPSLTLRLPPTKRPTSITALHAPSHLLHTIHKAFLQLPATWESSLVSNATIFTLGYPLLAAGLTLPGIAAAFVLGTLTWRAFGALGFLLVALYFLLGTAATKVKFQQKEKEQIAEKRSGKRGPMSVLGSGTAGVACAFASIIDFGGSSFSDLWRLGFVASFATKLSDTVSSEIGKAFGKTTYSVKNFKRVPRGTEGAISLEGTFAGLSASIVISAFAYGVHQISAQGALVCVAASQIANLFESYIGATIQDRDGFEWLNNDVVNILNILIGAALAIIFLYLMKSS